MLLADMVEGAIDAALEDREVAFNRIGVPEAAAQIFLDRMVDCAMATESRTDRKIDGAFIGHEIGFVIDLSFEDRLQRRCVDLRMWCYFTRPSRSTSATTASLPLPPCIPSRRLDLCLFASLPPT